MHSRSFSGTRWEVEWERANVLNTKNIEKSSQLEKKSIQERHKFVLGLNIELEMLGVVVWARTTMQEASVVRWIHNARMPTSTRIYVHNLGRGRLLSMAKDESECSHGKSCGKLEKKIVCWVHLMFMFIQSFRYFLVSFSCFHHSLSLSSCCCCSPQRTTLDRCLCFNLMIFMKRWNQQWLREEKMNFGYKDEIRQTQKLFHEPQCWAVHLIYYAD